MTRLVLPDFAIEVYMSRWEFSARYNLTASDAESISIDELLALADESERQGFLDLPMGYIPTWGTDGLRAAIVATYDNLEAEDVLTFAGAEEALRTASSPSAGERSNWPSRRPPST